MGLSILFVLGPSYFPHLPFPSRPWKCQAPMATTAKTTYRTDKRKAMLKQTCVMLQMGEKGNCILSRLVPVPMTGLKERSKTWGPAAFAHFILPAGAE